MLKNYFVLNLYFLMLFIEIRETRCAYVLEVQLHQYMLVKWLTQVNCFKGAVSVVHVLGFPIPVF